MAKKEDILYALELFHENRPKKLFDEVNKSQVGEFAVIKYLHETSTAATSADICKFLKISSARVAVLIKRLDAKGFVVIMRSEADARSKIVKLSDTGMAFAAEIRGRMYATMEKIVDEFGLEELEELFKKLYRLKSILEENMPEKSEEYHD